MALPLELTRFFKVIGIVNRLEAGWGQLKALRQRLRQAAAGGINLTLSPGEVAALDLFLERIGQIFRKR